MVALAAVVVRVQSALQERLQPQVMVEQVLQYQFQVHLLLMQVVVVVVHLLPAHNQQAAQAVVVQVVLERLQQEQQELLIAAVVVVAVELAHLLSVAQVVQELLYFRTQAQKQLLSVQV
jgi:hypothetical protein